MRANVGNTAIQRSGTKQRQDRVTLSHKATEGRRIKQRIILRTRHPNNTQRSPSSQSEGAIKHGLRANGHRDTQQTRVSRAETHAEQSLSHQGHRRSNEPSPAQHRQMIVSEEYDRIWGFANEYERAFLADTNALWELNRSQRK